MWQKPVITRRRTDHNKLSWIITTQNFEDLQNKLYAKKCAQTFQEVQDAKMQDAIGLLQHQLNTASERIDGFQDDVGRVASIKAKALQEDTEKFHGLSTQVDELLADRRGLQSNLAKAKAMAVITNAKMSELHSVLMIRDKDMKIKLIAIGRIICPEVEAEIPLDVDTEEDIDSEEASCTSPFMYSQSSSKLPEKNVPQTLSLNERTLEYRNLSNEEKDSIVKIKHMNMLKVLHELHFALDLKLKELTQNNFNNADEIKRLRAIEQESKEQIAHQRHEINSLKRLLQESRADVARVDRAGGYR